MPNFCISFVGYHVNGQYIINLLNICPFPCLVEAKATDQIHRPSRRAESGQSVDPVGVDLRIRARIKRASLTPTDVSRAEQNPSPAHNPR